MRYSFGNFQWQMVFFLRKRLPEYHLRHVAAVCWHSLNLRGQTSFHAGCPPRSVPSISCRRSRGRQREFSFQSSSYPTEKTRLMPTGTKAALEGKFCPQLHQKGTREQGLTEQVETQDHPSSTGLLAAIFFPALMALSYCHTWNQVKCMLIPPCKATSFSFSNESGVLANSYPGCSEEPSHV